MKDKINDIINSIKKTIPSAAIITLACADVSLLVCTLVGADKIMISLLPLWVFILFALLYFVLDIIPYTSQKWWIKSIVLAIAALIIVLLIAFL